MERVPHVSLEQLHMFVMHARQDKTITLNPHPGCVDQRYQQLQRRDPRLPAPLLLRNLLGRTQGACSGGVLPAELLHQGPVLLRAQPRLHEDAPGPRDHLDSS